jgi:hypothetical protein
VAGLPWFRTLAGFAFTCIHHSEHLFQRLLTVSVLQYVRVECFERMVEIGSSRH